MTQEELTKTLLAHGYEVLATSSQLILVKKGKDQYANLFPQYLTEDIDILVKYLDSKLYEMPCPPGEIIDRISIVSIKKSKLTNPVVLASLEMEQFHLFQLLGHLVSRHSSEPEEFILSSLKKLIEINTKQWDWEDRVRTEPDTGFAAKEARNCNTERSKVKDEINQYFGYPLDPKCYRDSVS